ncbi:hypothetical protein F5Y04DRAFT_291811 [Hypomontagnella monticulosa]|nr:hypothetical protein F5Y04DRAFT_291811 [Hypomontagnella monticulosa]
MASDDTHCSNQFTYIPPLVFINDSRSSLQDGPWVETPNIMDPRHHTSEPTPEADPPSYTMANLDAQDSFSVCQLSDATNGESTVLVPSSSLKEASPFSSPSETNAMKAFKLRDWAWEFTATGFSICCTIAMISVLYAFQNKPLSSWQFMFQISPNSVVSLLSGFSRAAISVSVASCISQLKWIYFARSAGSLYQMETFDLASRGPWGALVLLWRLNFKAKLAAVASLITIL